MRIIRNVLDPRVLAVAVIGEVGDWTAYIGSVEGKNYNQEQLEIFRTGSKLSFELAKVIFPEIAESYIWRENNLR